MSRDYEQLPQYGLVALSEISSTHVAQCFAVAGVERKFTTRPRVNTVFDRCAVWRNEVKLALSFGLSDIFLEGFFMPKNATYPEIVAFANDEPAVYIGAKTFAHLALASLQTALQELQSSKDRIVSLAAQPFAVRLESVHVGSDPKTEIEAEFTVDPIPGSPEHKEVFLVSPKTLTLMFSLGVIASSGAFDSVLTTITLKINDLRFEITTSTDAIIVSAGEAKITPSFCRACDFYDLLEKYKIDVAETTRIEGMLLYGGLASSINSTIATPHRIDLRRMFPGISIADNARIETSIDRKFIYIGCDSGLIDDECKCRDVGNGIGAVQASVATLAPNSTKTHVGKFRLGVPATINPKDVTIPTQKMEGDAGIFLPFKTLDSSIKGPYPALRIDVNNNGFIGWRATGIVDFDPKSFRVDIKPEQGLFLINFSFRVEIYGNIHADLGKLGKPKITNFSAMQSGPNANKCRIGFYLVTGTEHIYFKPVLEELTIETHEIDQDIGTLIGTCFGSEKEVAKYIIDTIINAALAYALSRELDLALRRAMQKLMIPLLGAQYVAEMEGLSLELARGKNLRPGSVGDQRGFLVSCGLAG